MRLPFDHYISRSHMRQWATSNRISTLSRSSSKFKVIEVGNGVAGERGLNHPALEARYAKLESALGRALPRLLDFSRPPSDTSLRAIREYAVLVHDRYPALRGSAAGARGIRGGNAVMVPNPAHWGSQDEASDPLALFATEMDREQLKAARWELLPSLAQLLPPIVQVFRVGPMLLGDAGVHAITLHPDARTERTYVAMPLSADALVVFGKQPAAGDEARQIGHLLPLKIAMESTVVIDTPKATLINDFVADMWRHQPDPIGAGRPRAIRVFSRLRDISTYRSG